MTLLAFALLLAGASAQKTELIDRNMLYSADSLTMDKLYNYWDTYVGLHPKDEVAWRNLFEVSEKIVSKLSSKTSWNVARQHRKKLNVMGRMEKAIPGTYTFYACAYEGNYVSEEEKRKMEEIGVHWEFYGNDKYADAAIAALPTDATAFDYEGWIQYLIAEGDSVWLDTLLTRYFNSGQYPEEALQYHFNELQGMDEGGVYIGAHEGDIIGKLILQRVLGVHRDKILYDENATHVHDYVRQVFARIGTPLDDEALKQKYFNSQDETLITFMQYIVEHSKRSVYLSAHSMSELILGKGLPDELKACFYNEGLTMRYSTKPYDNMAVKRRNIEKRYRLEYLRMPFHPEEKGSKQRFQTYVGHYAMNYMRLLHDQLPYYKRHDKERYQWLHDIFTDIIDRLEKQNYGVADFKNYLK